MEDKLIQERAVLLIYKKDNIYLKLSMFMGLIGWLAIITGSPENIMQYIMAWIYSISVTIIFIGLYLEKRSEKRMLLDMSRDEIKRYRKFKKDVEEYKGNHEFVSEDGLVSIVVDTDYKKFSLAKFSDKSSKIISKTYEYSDLLSVEFFEDFKVVSKTTTKSNISNAVLGGIVFGPVGAIVGGLASGKKKKTTEFKSTKNMGLRFVVNNDEEPTYIIKFLDQKIDSNSVKYKRIMNKIKKWEDLTQVMITQTNHQKN